MRGWGIQQAMADSLRAAAWRIYIVYVARSTCVHMYVYKRSGGGGKDWLGEGEAAAAYMAKAKVWEK